MRQHVLVIMLLAKDFSKNSKVSKNLIVFQIVTELSNTRNIKTITDAIKLMEPDYFGWKQSKIDPYIGLTVGFYF